MRCDDISDACDIATGLAHSVLVAGIREQHCYTVRDRCVYAEELLVWFCGRSMHIVVVSCVTQSGPSQSVVGRDFCDICFVVHRFILVADGAVSAYPCMGFSYICECIQPQVVTCDVVRLWHGSYLCRDTGVFRPYRKSVGVVLFGSSCMGLDTSGSDVVSVVRFYHCTTNPA